VPTRTTQKKSILLLGNYRPTLPLAKKFSSQGYEVICGSLGCEIDFKQSRYVSQIWEHPDGTRAPTIFFQELGRFCNEHTELTAIFPVLEDYVRLFAEHAHLFPKLPPVIMNDPALVLKCVDKLFMMKLAEECSVPIAPFAKVHNESELNQAVKEIGLPIVIRPANATIALNEKKAVTTHSNTDIENLNIDWQKHSQGLILQRRFDGIRHNIYFAAVEGRICRYLDAVITRTNCVDGTGLAVETVTIEPNQNLKHQTERMVGALNYTGVGLAQYLVNEETGESSFLEINPRIAGCHKIPEYAGLELGTFLTELTLTGQPDITPHIGRGNIRYAWTSADLIAAKTAWRKKEISSGKTIGWTAKILLAGLRSNIHSVFSRADPKPGLLSLAKALPGMARAIEALKLRKEG
jgi:predicted ATP-grasp superfamily ATP-dependent carboligase